MMQSITNSSFLNVRHIMFLIFIRCFNFYSSLFFADPHTANPIVIMKILHDAKYKIYVVIYAHVFCLVFLDCVLDDPLTYR